jgi:trans-aconitate methyltransferase
METRERRVHAQSRISCYHWVYKPDTSYPETISVESSMAARFYDELAHWWPLFSPPEHYAVEAEDLLPRLGPPPTVRPATLLELGSGGGSLASHLKRHYRLTLTDRSRGMLAVNQAVNPECEHFRGDMRTLRLDRTFDVVLIHDAIMYATKPDDVLATLRTAAIHCRHDGTVAVLPDCVKETFTPGTDEGGSDGEDGRALRYLEWRWDPDPVDDTYTVDYAFLLREADGEVSVVHDRHVEGVFDRTQWLEWFTEVGLSAHSSLDPWSRDVFIARHTTP